MKKTIFPHWGKCFGCSSDQDLNDFLMCKGCQETADKTQVLPVSGPKLVPEVSQTEVTPEVDQPVAKTDLSA